MERVKRSEWIEWLDELAFAGMVDLEPEPAGHDEYRFRSAEYAPFDNVIEVMLEDGSGVHRLLIDSPIRIWVDDVDGEHETVVFDTATDRVVLTRHHHFPVLNYRV